MRSDASELFDGLLWYLKVRNWALTQILSAQHGCDAFYLRMHHELYFVNFMSAIDCVLDHLKHDKAGQGAFAERIKNGLGSSDFSYVRELRNSLVHRGLDLSAAGHSDSTHVYVLCPQIVADRNGKTHTTTFTYLSDLAQRCRVISDPAIYDLLNAMGLLDPKRHELSLDEFSDAIDQSYAMPNWVKVLSKQGLARINFPQIRSDLATFRVGKMKELLAAG